MELQGGEELNSAAGSALRKWLWKWIVCQQGSLQITRMLISAPKKENGK